jgi:hypothetical protein
VVSQLPKGSANCFSLRWVIFQNTDGNTILFTFFLKYCPVFFLQYGCEILLGTGNRILEDNMVMFVGYRFHVSSYKGCHNRGKKLSLFAFQGQIRFTALFFQSIGLITKVIPGQPLLHLLCAEFGIVVSNEEPTKGKEQFMKNAGRGIFFVSVKTDTVQGDFFMVTVQALDPVGQGLEPLAPGAKTIDHFPESCVIGVLIHQLHLDRIDFIGILKPD